MAKNAPKTTANTENNVYNQHKTTTCRITDEDEKNENTEPETGRALDKTGRDSQQNDICYIRHGKIYSLDVSFSTSFARARATLISGQIFSSPKIL